MARMPICAARPLLSSIACTPQRVKHNVYVEKMARGNRSPLSRTVSTIESSSFCGDPTYPKKCFPQEQSSDGHARMVVHGRAHVYQYVLSSRSTCGKYSTSRPLRYFRDKSVTRFDGGSSRCPISHFSTASSTFLLRVPGPFL